LRDPDATVHPPGRDPCGGYHVAEVGRADPESPRLLLIKRMARPVLTPPTMELRETCRRASPSEPGATRRRSVQTSPGACDLQKHVGLRRWRQP
jgi:hypothetical protein